MDICHTKIKSKLRGWNLFQGIENGNRPQACIDVTSDLCCSLIPMFSNEDIVAIRVNNACRKGDSFVFVSAYMAAEEPAPPNLLRDLLVLTEIEQIPTILGTDANAHHTIWGSSDINPRGKNLLASCAMAEADINEFQPFKASGQTGSILYCYRKVGINWKDITMSFFKHAWDTAMCHWHGKKAQVYFSPNWERKARMITLTSFQLKWLEKLVLYHINEDNNVQAKLSASQVWFSCWSFYGNCFAWICAPCGALPCLKKPPLGIFLDIVGAFDNVTFRSFVAALRGLGMSKNFTSWIETLLRHRTVQVGLCGDKVKREVVKRNPQGGILSSFLWNCVLTACC